MESRFRELIGNLEGIINSYQELFALGSQKQKELVKGNVEAVDGLNIKEEKLIFQASRIEKERFRLAREMAAFYELPEGAALSELLEKAPGPEREKLNILLGELQQILSKIDKLNKENIALVQQALKFINFTVDVICQCESAASYSPGEKENKPESISRLVDKTV